MDLTVRAAIHHLTCKNDWDSRGQFVALPRAFDAYYRDEQRACGCGRDWFDVVQEFLRELPHRYPLCREFATLPKDS